jgi:hypothetical protein
MRLDDGRLLHRAIRTIGIAALFLAAAGFGVALIVGLQPEPKVGPSLVDQQ